MKFSNNNGVSLDRNNPSQNSPLCLLTIRNGSLSNAIKHYLQGHNGYTIYIAGCSCCSLFFSVVSFSTKMHSKWKSIEWHIFAFNSFPLPFLCVYIYFHFLLSADNKTVTEFLGKLHAIAKGWTVKHCSRQLKQKS